MRRELYPPDWPAISRRIRARAGFRCEGKGMANTRMANKSSPQGGVPSDAPGRRAKGLPFLFAYSPFAYSIANAAATRRRKRVEAGQMEMSFET